MPETATKTTPKLADRTGPCGAVRCACGTYQPGPPTRDPAWATCGCGHTKHIHAPQEGK